MSTKTELKEEFDYEDPQWAKDYHRENLELTLFFAIPFIGWTSLLICLAHEFIDKWVRTFFEVVFKMMKK